MKKLLALLLAVLMLLASCGPVTDDTTLFGEETDEPVVTDPSATEPVETDPPVKVDRVDYTIDVKEDTYVVNKDNGDQSDNTFSSDVELNVKTAGSNMTRYIYLKFDISSLAGDNDFTCIELDLMQTRRESNTPKFCVIDVFACPADIDVNNLTFNKQPTEMAHVFTNDQIGTEKITRSFPITDYVRYALSKGQREIVLCLKENNPDAPHRIRFASLESGADVPKLSVYYGTKVDDGIFTDKGIFDEPEVSTVGLDALFGQQQLATQTITVLEDTYVEAGSSSETNFGSSDILSFKGSWEKPSSYYRVVLLKFNIEEIPSNFDGTVNLVLNCNYRESGTPAVHLYACDPYEWDENSLTYNTIPERENLITSINVSTKGLVYFDITDYIKECRKNGDKLISFYLEGEQATERSLKFDSKESGSNIPIIEYSGSQINFTTYLKYNGKNPWEVAMNDVTAWLQRWEEIKKGGDSSFGKVVKDESEYTLSVDAAKYNETNGYDTKYTTRLTRNISTLKGYKASTAEVAQYDQYGGLMDESMKQEATGFFYVKKIGDRWWNIDPIGYPMFRASVVSVSMGSASQKEQFLAKYGTQDKWAQATTDRLRELGFNSFGGWCSIENFIGNDNPLNQTHIIGVASNYSGNIGTNESNGGSTYIKGDMIPAFDPDFAEYADGLISSTVKKYANSPEIYGWLSDNELPKSTLALDNAMKFDTEDIRLVYSYAVAWTFMYLKTGKINVSLSDITNELRNEFRAMMYDKYFSVVVPLIKKYDPNHMYMGCRFYENALEDEYIWRVAGYWCDVITYNYYGAWEADFELVSNQVKWAGKPFVITEFYAKGMDAWEKDNRMLNQSGAGWTVRTQDDRGKFYQNFVLSLLECKGCVGFDWFTYLDNDPDRSGSYQQNSNKGIFDNNGEEYTDLTKYMQELNTQKYNLIKFFDER